MKSGRCLLDTGISADTRSEQIVAGPDVRRAFRLFTYFVISASCICSALSGCGKSEPERATEKAPMEMWQMLATLDGASRDELKSARFRWLVEHLAGAFGEPPSVIGDQTFATQASLKEKGIGESLLDVLEAMNKTSNFRGPRDTYAEHLAVYNVLRTSGQSSADAVEAMNGLHVHEVIHRLTGR